MKKRRVFDVEQLIKQPGEDRVEKCEVQGVLGGPEGMNVVVKGVEMMEQWITAIFCFFEKPCYVYVTKYTF